MRSPSRSLLFIVIFAILAIAAGILGDTYKWAWASDWVAPLFMFLYLIALGNFSQVATSKSTTPAGRLKQWAKTAAVTVPIYAFLNIEMVGETPAAMRLFGLSWTMTPYAASRFLSFCGVIIGAAAVGLSWMESRRSGNAIAATPPTEPSR